MLGWTLDFLSLGPGLHMLWHKAVERTTSFHTASRRIPFYNTSPGFRTTSRHNQSTSLVAFRDLKGPSPQIQTSVDFGTHGGSGMEPRVTCTPLVNKNVHKVVYLVNEKRRWLLLQTLHCKCWKSTAYTVPFSSSTPGTIISININDNVADNDGAVPVYLFPTRRFTKRFTDNNHRIKCLTISRDAEEHPQAVARRDIVLGWKGTVLLSPRKM